MTKAVIGVDFSMSSPAICLELDGQVKIWYVNANKKVCTYFSIGNVTVEGFHYDPKNINDAKKKSDREVHADIERFIVLATTFDSVIPDVNRNEFKTAVFEAYAFGAKGRMAQIGENTGLMKAALASKGYRIETISPTSVKLLGAGTGKATKEEMAEAWFKEFGFHVHDQLGCGIGESPASDVIDSYFVLKSWQKQQAVSEAA